MSWGLSITLCVQIVFFLIEYYQNADIIAESEPLKAKIAGFEKRKALLTSATADHVTLIGALDTRNRWIRERLQSPIKILAKFERGRPNGIELRTFSANRNGGTLKLLTPDMDTAACWINGVFGNKVGRMTMEEKTEGRLLVVYTWND